MVRRLVWAAGILATVVVLALAGLAAYVARTWDRTYDAPLPEVHIGSNPTVLARGEYLFTVRRTARMPQRIVGRAGEAQ